MIQNSHPRPWLRYLARYLDISIYGFILIFIIILARIILYF